MDHRQEHDGLFGRTLSRRNALRALGLTGVAVAAGGHLAGAVGAAGPARPKRARNVRGPRSADVGSQLAELLGVDPAVAGGGETFKMGAVLAMTGAGSYYGQTMSRGIDLAVEHIVAAGGPQFEVKYLDHKSGDAQAGVDAMRELGEAGYPAKLASYCDNLGSMLPGTEQYRCFTLDGGGGTSTFAQGKPYFWGTRAITPNDAIPGLLEYTKSALPDARTLGFIGWDLGEPSNTQVREDILAKFEAAGYEFNGLYELYPVGESNYSTLLPKIQANEPDILIAYGSGQDPGHFASQYYVSGIEAPFFGFEYTPDGLNASNGAYDEYGFTFAADYFDESVGVSPLAKLFITEYEAAYDGEFPDFYAANFYENTLVMWEVIRRVIEAGGDFNRGEELDAALQENLTVVSVYGGDESTIGSYTLDPVTHSVLQRPMGVFQYKDGGVTPLAFFDIDAADFRLA